MFALTSHASFKLILLNQSPKDYNPDLWFVTRDQSDKALATFRVAFGHNTQIESIEHRKGWLG